MLKTNRAFLLLENTMGSMLKKQLVLFNILPTILFLSKRNDQTLLIETPLWHSDLGNFPDCSHCLLLTPYSFTIYLFLSCFYCLSVFIFHQTFYFSLFTFYFSPITFHLSLKSRLLIVHKHLSPECKGKKGGNFARFMRLAIHMIIQQLVDPFHLEKLGEKLIIANMFFNKIP